jgi:hypothetical protein
VPASPNATNPASGPAATANVDVDVDVDVEVELEVDVDVEVDATGAAARWGAGLVHDATTTASTTSANPNRTR